MKLQYPTMKVNVPREIWRPFTPEVRIGFVIDSERTVRMVGETELGVLQLSEAGLFELAVQNLMARSEEPLVEVAKGVYSSPYSDEYDATRLLVPYLFLGLKLKGQPVAFIPNRSTLLVTGSEDEVGLLEAYARVRLAQKGEAREVSAIPLLLGDDGWVPWVPPLHSAAHAAVQTLIHEQVSADLTEGSALVQELWPQLGMAQMATRTAADGMSRELAVMLPEGRESLLLPKADVVVTSSATQSWEEFIRDNEAALVPVEGSEEQWWRYQPLRQM